MVDIKSLKAEMVRNGYTQKQLAEKIGISEKTLCLRLKNGDFGLDEADKLIEVLNIKNPIPIFFAQSVN